MSEDFCEPRFGCSEVSECVQKEELSTQLALKCEECDALMIDLQRANDRLSEIDGQTAAIAEKVLDLCFI